MSSKFITANHDEDVVLEFCKELAWKRSYVKGAKNHNRSWPQVVPLLEVLPHLLGNSTTRDRFKVILQDYGTLINFLREYAPGRRNERDSWTGFESWGYELLTAAQYLQDDRYLAEILPKMHTVDPIQQLFVIYPPFFASVFETNLSLLAKPALKNLSVDSPSNEVSISSSSSASFRSPVQPITPPAPTVRKSSLNAQAVEYQPKSPTLPMRYESLTIELQALFKRSVPSRIIVSNRQQLVERIASALRHRFPKVQLRVELFGSSATGLDFVESDLDLCIIVPENLFRKDLYCLDKKQREYGSYYNMHCIAALLRRIGMANVIPIARATVPICKFEDPWMNLKGDINTQHDMGVENSRMIKEYVYLEPRVRPFLYAVKTFVKKRDINSSSMDTLSSYTYVLMGLFYLMTCNPPVIPNLQDLGFNDCGNPACRYHSDDKETCYRNDARTFNVRFHTCVNVLRPDQPEPQKVKSAFKATTWRCYNTQSLGELLVGFFDYYGDKHDYNLAVSIFRGEAIVKQRKWKRKSTVLAVQDPFITERNTAGTCTRDGFDRIIDEFRRASRELKSGASFATICLPIPTLSAGNQLSVQHVTSTLIRPQQEKPIEIKKPPLTHNKRETGRATFSLQSTDFIGTMESINPDSLSKGRSRNSSSYLLSESQHSPVSYGSSAIQSRREYEDAEEDESTHQDDVEEEYSAKESENEDEEGEYSEEEYKSNDKIVDEIFTGPEIPFEPLPDTHYHDRAINEKQGSHNEEYDVKQFLTQKVAKASHKIHVPHKPKKATLKLLEMPYYVDKLDIIEAMELCGFEVITIRCEVTGGDSEYMPIREWFVRVVGGLNKDLPPRFELQDMTMTVTYETRRLVAYKGIAI